MNDLALRSIQALQQAMESSDALTTDMQEFTDHFFAPGVYLRTLFIPKGHLVVGAEHLHPTLNILMKGKIAVATSSGDKLIAEAPYIFIADAGKKVGYAIEDVWYANIFPVENENLQDWEKRYIAPIDRRIQ